MSISRSAGTNKHDSAAKEPVVPATNRMERRILDNDGSVLCVNVLYKLLDHVLEMWRWHLAYHQGGFEGARRGLDFQIIASFWLYHDAIYDPRAKDNEQESADLWSADSRGYALDVVRDLVDESIFASADHFDRGRYRDDCLTWCLNLDLLRLGTPEHEFRQHGLNLRAEYDHLTDLEWIKASAEFRAKVMAQPAIFSFPEFAAFETQARRNLTKTLVQDWQTLGYLMSLAA